jgi:hypothetical protein
VIALVLGTLRARWAQAVTLGVLAVVAVACAVAGPAYLGGVDRAVADREVAAASVPERSLTLSSSVQIGGGGSGLDFARLGTDLVTMADFTTVFAASINVLGVEEPSAPGGGTASSLVFRQGACDHLTMVAGRCLLGGGDVVIGERTAIRRNLRPGDPITIAFAQIDPVRKVYLPAGAPATLTVAGVYRVPDPTALYWGTSGYFASDPRGNPGEPLFVERSTLKAIDHAIELDTIDSLMASHVAPQRLDAMRAVLGNVEDRLTSIGLGINEHTSIPDLLDRVDASRREAHELVPVALVPLVALAWFVIFLAVGFGTAARRRELGLLALRGLRSPIRWVLAGGEHAVPVAIGAALGYPLGLLVAGILARVRLGQPASSGGLAWYAVAAGGGALLAALAAQRRELFGPVAGLLRQVSAGSRRRASVAVEAVVVVLAVAAAASLRSSGGRLTGVGALVPALVIAAIAVVAARAVTPLFGRFGRLALRRGRIGTGLAGVQMGRRPGVSRLFVLLAAAVAVLGFATAAIDTAAVARAERAEIGAGAVRVLTVNPVSRAKLLAATHTIDPDGRFAMAVATLPAGAPKEPARLAVDSARLASVAAWRPDFGGPPPARLAELLAAPLPAPVEITGQRVQVDLTAQLPSGPGVLPDQQPGLTVLLAPNSGASAISLDLGPLVPGAQTLGGQALDCARGCRLVGLGVARAGGGSFDATVTLRQLRTDDRVAIGTDRFGTADGWQAATPDRDSLSADASGLKMQIHAVDGTRLEGWVSPTDRPVSLPVVATATLTPGARLTGLDGVPTRVRQVATVAGLPRLGRSGVLVDLAVADRLATDAGSADMEQVWLGPAAPADVTRRLADQGVVVSDDSGIAVVRSQLDRQGGALALWFYLLAALLVVLLAAGGLRLVAAVDADRGAADLRALRTQGIPAGVTGRAGLLGYLVVVLVALLVGPLAAAVAWLVAGSSLPTGAADPALWPAPRWPQPDPVLWSWAAAAALLLAVAAIAALDLRRRVRHSDVRGDLS